MLNVLKKIPWKTILLTLFFWALFWEIKETIARERNIFLIRWFYSEKSYAKNIEVLTYILTDEQISYMLSHPDEEVQQPTQKELYLKPVSVVLRFRNRYDGVVQGKLSWTMPEWGWNPVNVIDIPITDNPYNPNQKFGNIIISLGIQFAIQEDIPPDPITVRWDELYVYR